MVNKVADILAEDKIELVDDQQILRAFDNLPEGAYHGVGLDNVPEGVISILKEDDENGMVILQDLNNAELEVLATIAQRQVTPVLYANAGDIVESVDGATMDIDYENNICTYKLDNKELIYNF